MILTTLMSCFMSFKVSGLTAITWFYEIFMCGVNKLSMSITSLSGPTPETRTWWMPFFEVYFGIAIKYINPAVLTYMFLEFVAADLESPYAEQPPIMQIYATVIIFALLLILTAPMFLCEYPEIFEHNIDLEFNADNIFEAKIRAMQGNKIQDETQLTMQPTSKPNIDN